MPRRLASSVGFPRLAEERLDEVVPGLETLRVRDLIRVGGSDDETVLCFIAHNAEAMQASSSHAEHV